MRGNPFDELEEMLDRLSRQVGEGMTGGGLQVPGSVPVDVADAGEEYIVTADLPGYETDDISLTLSEERFDSRRCALTRRSTRKGSTSGVSARTRRQTGASTARAGRRGRGVGRLRKRRFDDSAPESRRGEESRQIDIE